MPIIKLTKVERRRFLTFVLCLLLALSGWMFLALKNKYVYTAKTVLVYKNFPQNKAFHPLQSDTVDLQVEGTGWQLLFARLRINPQSIAVSLNSLNIRNFVVFSDQLYNINKQLETSQKVISIKPDTLYFDFSKRTVKRVPVKLVSDLKFVKQYEVSGPIEVVPRYVTISGPQEEIAGIREWRTDTLSLEKIRHTTMAKVAMEAKKQKNINIFPTTAEVKIPIDEFTEKEVSVPLKIINNPKYLDVSLFPKKVRVKFMVSLSDYDDINEDMMEARADLSEWSLLRHTQLRVQMSRFPEYCKLISVSPDKVDFIIER
ncbi:hypothetical protein C7T94_17290 [Pedobacter yulinensis]|uniref:YbbR-like domain-containing protein n=1 Tax=Pedobacter yulinensis TaxID=2126353 RepID=A0A2T3HHR9_9SPHI|nr:YbbR-like domain-containing protein [Pedobacter yulinensis]PST81943.1 hypothetical protein C7T94_17290 [Pedobacter yulinensis]